MEAKGSSGQSSVYNTYATPPTPNPLFQGFSSSQNINKEIIKSLFYGIRVTMYYDDHNPPHFHAEYNGNKAIIEIDTARCIKGALPSRQLKLILAWCVLHQDELMQNWELSKDGKPLNRINPLV